MAKIVLTAARDIALDKLVASDANVRRIKAGASVEIRPRICRGGDCCSPSVRPVFDDRGGETGTFAVSTGGRCLAALKLLVKQKRLAKKRACPIATFSPG